MLSPASSLVVSLSVAKLGQFTSNRDLRGQHRARTGLGMDDVAKRIVH